MPAPWAGAVDHAAPRVQIPPSLGLLCPPGAGLDRRGAAGAGARQPGPGRGLVPWASSARRGRRSRRASPGPGRGRLPWAGAASAGAAPPDQQQPRPVRRRPGPGPSGQIHAAKSTRRPPNSPPDFAPRIGPGFSPVTRGPGDSPAHNARPRRSRVTRDQTIRTYMKSTISFNCVCMKSADFANLTQDFAEKSQNSRLKPKNLLLILQESCDLQKIASTMGQAKPSRRRKKSAAPFLERRSFNLVILFSIWSCARLMVQFLHFGRSLLP